MSIFKKVLVVSLSAIMVLCVAVVTLIWFSLHPGLSKLESLSGLTFTNDTKILNSWHEGGRDLIYWFELEIPKNELPLVFPHEKYKPSATSRYTNNWGPEWFTPDSIITAESFYLSIDGAISGVLYDSSNIEISKVYISIMF